MPPVGRSITAFCEGCRNRVCQRQLNLCATLVWCGKGREVSCLGRPARAPRSKAKPANFGGLYCAIERALERAFAVAASKNQSLRAGREAHGCGFTLRRESVSAFVSRHAIDLEYAHGAGHEYCHS